MLREQGGRGAGFMYKENNFKKNNYGTIQINRTIQIKVLKSIKRLNLGPTSTIGFLQLIIDASIYQFTL